MNIVPIVFAFDNNLILPAEVAICSLLQHAKDTTYYQIYVLHGSDADLSGFEADTIKKSYPHCDIVFKNVGDAFQKAFEIRGITIPAYYRLLIPEIITEHDKIIYSDVDVIFQGDLSELYQTDLKDNYLAATYDWGMMIDENGRRYAESIEGLSADDYLQAGFLLMNNRKMREDNVVFRFKELARHNYRYQDQDIINITCRNRKMVLPLFYNMIDYAFQFMIKEPDRMRRWCSEEDLKRAECPIMIHYNGHKPWKKYSINFDIWCEYYRKSPFFDPHYYFEFYYYRLNIFDQLPLWKRIKILVRYFVYGKRVI